MGTGGKKGGVDRGAGGGGMTGARGGEMTGGKGGRWDERRREGGSGGSVSGTAKSVKCCSGAIQLRMQPLRKTELSTPSFSLSIPPSSPTHPPLSVLWLTFISPPTSTCPPFLYPPPLSSLSFSLCTSPWVSRFHNASEWRKTSGVGLSPPLLFICPSSFSLPEQVNLSLFVTPVPIRFIHFFRCYCMLDFCLSLSLIFFF